MAVRFGMETAREAVFVVVMADGSDSPYDVVKYYRTLHAQNVDCVFGSRFTKQSSLENYPFFKLVLNRVMNLLISILFAYRYNDTSNAFKMYRREVISGCSPLLSRHFNLTVELPLKAIIRGYRYAVVPVSWKERQKGATKLRLKEMGSQYLFIIVYCAVERFLMGKNYRSEPSDFEKKNTAKLRATK